MTVFERIKEMNEKEFAHFLHEVTGGCSDYMLDSLSVDYYDFPKDGECAEDCEIRKKMEIYNEDTSQKGVPCYGCFKHYLNSDCGVYDYYEKYAKEEDE